MDSNPPASIPEREAACSVCSRVVIAWECGSIRMTNEDMLHCHCHICGEQHPARYLIIGGPIEPEFSARRWWGRCDEPIDAADGNVCYEDKSNSVVNK
jgi:hypothetical protein